MIIEKMSIGGVAIEFADNAFAKADAHEIVQRQALFDRTVRETVRQIQRQEREKDLRKSG
ncbi:hypothetical protein [Butyricicoccus sp. Marseille-Q5471]|uniref:hypothetical protein n=1 Tax=Butyricicoccus sp. Marseille-Q5471 TaxID=3039493 RepID=UPI0024BCA675|nr:hypothetical protein [Butyricicoccus sp. Marseille-Q5471]